MPPVHGQRGPLAIVGSCKLKPGLHSLGSSLGINLRRFWDNIKVYSFRMAQVESPIGNVEGVASPVACFSCPEVPPESPVIRAVGRAVGPGLGGPQPEIPVQVSRDRREVFRERRHSPASSLKGIDFSDLSDHTALYGFYRTTHSVVGVALVSELGSHLHLVGDPGQFPAFPCRMCQRLLAVDMLAHQHGLPGGMKVRVVWSAHHHRIDGLVHFIKHPAEVTVLPRFWKARPVLAGPLLVHVTHCHNILSRNLSEVASSLASDSDTGNVELVVRRGGTDPGRCSCPVSRSDGGGSSKEVTAIRSKHEDFYPVPHPGVNPPK